VKFKLLWLEVRGFTLLELLLVLGTVAHHYCESGWRNILSMPYRHRSLLVELPGGSFWENLWHSLQVARNMALKTFEAHRRTWDCILYCEFRGPTTSPALPSTEMSGTGPNFHLRSTVSMFLLIWSSLLSLKGWYRRYSSRRTTWKWSHSTAQVHLTSGYVGNANRF